MAGDIHIPVSGGLFAIVSAEDRHLADKRWNSNQKGDRRYALRKEVFPKGSGRQKTVSLHRAVVGHMPLGTVVDHINGDTLDCRRENLRVVDKVVNNRNRVGAQKNSKSGILGVHPYQGKWVATIRHGGKQNYLGFFANLEQASEARLAAEKNLWGVEPRRKPLHGEA